MQTSVRKTKILKFLETRGIPGLCFIQSDSSKREVALWLLLTVGAIMLTIHDLHAQIVQFLAEPTSINAQIVHAPNYTAHAPTACFEVNPYSLISRLEPLRPATDGEDALRKIELVYGTQLLDALDCMLQVGQLNFEFIRNWHFRKTQIEPLGLAL